MTRAIDVNICQHCSEAELLSMASGTLTFDSEDDFLTPSFKLAPSTISRHFPGMTPKRFVWTNGRMDRVAPEPFLHYTPLPDTFG